jgi:hypothetical protein
VPMAADRNHALQTSQKGAEECSRVIVAAPPNPDAAMAIAVARTNPGTWRNSLKVNGRPNQRSRSQTTTTGSLAAQTPLRTEVRRLLSLIMLAAKVPAITPTTRAGRARRPRMIRRPTAIPEAGQNTATSPCSVRKASPSRAARKYETAMAAASSANEQNPSGPTPTDAYRLTPKGRQSPFNVSMSPEISAEARRSSVRASSSAIGCCL